MKRTLLLIALMLGAAATASAQWFDFSSNRRLEIGINVGDAAHTTQYARTGIGFNVNIIGFHVDYLGASPQHRYNNKISDTIWEDDKSFMINAGYQIPVLRWLKLVPVVGYMQTNEGLTDGSTINIETGEHTSTLYHDYNVKEDTRIHYFNYGGGISIQPLKWFSINAMYTRYACYAGISINLLGFAD